MNLYGEPMSQMKRSFMFFRDLSVCLDQVSQRPSVVELSCSTILVIAERAYNTNNDRPTIHEMTQLPFAVCGYVASCRARYVHTDGRKGRIHHGVHE